MKKVLSLPTVGLLVIKDRRLLLAFSKNKQCFYLPGGKIDNNESPVAALCREVAEELNISIKEDELEYYTHISAPAYGEEKGIIMEQDCFFLHKPVEPTASAEIGELRYFTVNDYKQQTKIALGVLMILQQLKMAGLID
ncbi:MAG: NUDIX domain-containing protein [Chitinophagaceae bacterium]